MADEAHDRLRLARTRGIGPRSYARLIGRYGTAGAALQALPHHPAIAGRDVAIPTRAAVEAEMAAAARCGARLLWLDGPDYPPYLAAIPDPPPVLWAIGDIGLIAAPGIAVVGARNASANGVRIAAQLARDLGQAGRVVVSGLARGIDRAAHEAALDTGTVAVLAGGVDVVYPPQNADLARAIAARGLLLSEAPMGEQPTARSFPRRNRIVSGLTAGVVLVEAAVRSGSLITARMALEQGREAMAVPGSPLDARAEGCNALIRDGAALIRTAEDVIEALGRPATLRPTPGSLPRTVPLEAPPAPDAPVPPDAARLLALIGADPVEIDALAAVAGLEPPALAALLLDLELDGSIDRHPGGRVSRR